MIVSTFGTKKIEVVMKLHKLLKSTKLRTELLTTHFGSSESILSFRRICHSL